MELLARLLCPHERPFFFFLPVMTLRYTYLQSVSNHVSLLSVVCLHFLRLLGSLFLLPPIYQSYHLKIHTASLHN